MRELVPVLVCARGLVPAKTPLQRKHELWPRPSGRRAPCAGCHKLAQALTQGLVQTDPPCTPEVCASLFCNIALNKLDDHVDDDDDDNDDDDDAYDVDDDYGCDNA